MRVCKHGCQSFLDTSLKSKVEFFLSVLPAVSKHEREEEEEFLNAKKNLNCILGLHASINLRL